jgi:hypothetical protein
MKRSRTVCHSPTSILEISSIIRVSSRLNTRYICSYTATLDRYFSLFSLGFIARISLRCSTYTKGKNFPSDIHFYLITRQYGVNAECVYPRYISVVWRISLCQSWIYLDMTYSSHLNHSNDAYGRITIKDKAKQSAIVLIDIAVRY